MNMTYDRAWVSRRLRRTAATLSVVGTLALPAHGGTAAAQDAGTAPAVITPPSDAILPALPGRFAVGTEVAELVDASRADPFAPTPQRRRVIAQLWYPRLRASHAPVAMYMEPAVGASYDASLGMAAGSYESLPTRAHEHAPSLYRSGGWPVVLFSPGNGLSRHMYTVMLEGLASEGFVVVALDHPYDAVVIELADGEIIPGAPPPTPDRAEADAVASLQVRLADASFVLDELPALARHLRISIDMQSVGFMGHSLGGATASLALLQDDRVQAAVNLDGTIFGLTAMQDVARPQMFLTSVGHDLNSDPSWSEYWSHLKGPRWAFQLQGSTHSTYTDLAPLSDVLGVKQRVPPEQLARLIGSIDGIRASEVQLDYVTAFFRATLSGRSSLPLCALHGRDPEMISLSDEPSTH